MKAKNLHLFSISAIVLLVFSISAGALVQIPANENAKENAKAPEKSLVITPDWQLERVDFIHYAKTEKPTPGKPPAANTCYKLMGVKWSAFPVNYAINPANPQGLSEAFVTSAISASAETWDNSTSRELFNNSFAVDYSATYGTRNNVNAIAFGDYDSNNVIAITSVWYTKAGKQIVEFDMLLNTRFNWGDATASQSIMDLQNIATHEFGHSVGMNDIYSSLCSLVTMYGYGADGETRKRTLEQADITGLQKMYGA